MGRPVHSLGPAGRAYLDTPPPPTVVSSLAPRGTSGERGSSPNASRGKRRRPTESGAPSAADRRLGVGLDHPYSKAGPVPPYGHTKPAASRRSDDACALSRGPEGRPSVKDARIRPLTRITMFAGRDADSLSSFGGEGQGEEAPVVFRDYRPEISSIGVLLQPISLVC